MQAVLGSSTPRHAPTEPPRYPFQTKPHQVGTPSSPSDAPHHNGGPYPHVERLESLCTIPAETTKHSPARQSRRAVEDKSAYIVGTGLAGLSAACYLIRDAQMDGSRVHLFERDAEPGGACDGWEYPQLGFTMRGGREMDNHFEVMWDLFRSIPSIEDENMSILDYYYQLNKRRSQLFPVPRNGQPGRRRRPRQYIQPVRQGVHGDHEPVLHPRRATRRPSP